MNTHSLGRKSFLELKQMVIIVNNRLSRVHCFKVLIFLSISSMFDDCVIGLHCHVTLIYLYTTCFGVTWAMIRFINYMVQIVSLHSFYVERNLVDTFINALIT
jgi:hypothetical protein